jgi:uncharacterized protein YmfQ (DUF2313 family)
MSRDPETVLQDLLSKTPPGQALPLAELPGANWPLWLKPLAAEISRFEGMAEAMMAEVNPGEANYLLTDYERVLGPDPYGRDSVPLSIADRQALALSRWARRYGVRPADFIALAASFGVTITITEYQLTEVGLEAGDLLVSHPAEFQWLVQMPPAAVEVFTAGGSSAGDLLGSYAPSLVEPIIAGRAPAHTTPVFSYS